MATGASQRKAIKPCFSKHTARFTMYVTGSIINVRKPTINNVAVSNSPCSSLRYLSSKSLKIGLISGVIWISAVAPTIPKKAALATLISLFLKFPAIVTLQPFETSNDDFSFLRLRFEHFKDLSAGPSRYDQPQPLQVTG